MHYQLCLIARMCATRAQQCASIKLTFSYPSSCIISISLPFQLHCDSDSKMSSPRQSIFDANAKIASLVRPHVRAILNAKLKMPVNDVSMDFGEMLTNITNESNANWFSVHVEHELIDYQARILAKEDMTQLEWEEEHELQNQVIDECSYKASVLSNQILASLPHKPTNSVDLCVGVHSYALFDGKPVLYVCVKCA